MYIIKINYVYIILYTIIIMIIHVKFLVFALVYSQFFPLLGNELLLNSQYVYIYESTFF